MSKLDIAALPFRKIATPLLFTPNRAWACRKLTHDDLKRPKNGLIQLRNNHDSSKCTHCGGKLERQTITQQQPWGSELYEFENVPALVCRKCGEVYLEAEVGQLIDKIIQQHPEPKRYHQVPVFSLAEFSF